MFYEKLAEAKNEKRRLSTKQKIGVGGAGALATLLSSRHYKPVFSWEDGEPERKKITDAGKERLRDLNLAQNVVIDGKRGGTFHPDGTPDYKHSLRNLKVGDTAHTPGSGLKHVEITEGVKREIDQLLEAPDPWAAPRHRNLIKQYMADEVAAKDALDSAVSNRKRIRHGIVGLTAGYGAKKLFDRYNARKQERN